MALSGIYTVAPTPFDLSGGLDLSNVERLVTFFSAHGVQGTVVLGVMGEAHALREGEREQVIEAFRTHLPSHLDLVVGMSGAAEDAAVGMALTAARYEPKALLVAPPPVQDDEVIVAYYRRLSEAVDTPIIVHDYPDSTGVVMAPTLIARLYEDVATIRYLKLEDPPTGLKLARLRALIGEDLGVFGGLGGMYAFEELDRGAAGIITGFAYPEFLVDIHRRYRRGDLAGAAQVMYDIAPLVRWEFQRGLGVSLRKHALVARGVLRTATTRQSGGEADAVSLGHLERILRHLRSRGYDV